jgi:hypothetical protein
VGTPDKNERGNERLKWICVVCGIAGYASASALYVSWLRLELGRSEDPDSIKRTVAVSTLADAFLVTAGAFVIYMMFQ